MAKQIQFKFGKINWQAGLTKVDREKVYGYVEEIVYDKNNSLCTLASLLDNGSTIVPNGSTALKTVDTYNREVDKKSLKTVYLDGSDAILVPSSYDGEISLTEATLDNIYDLEVTSVYQMDFEIEADKLQAVNILKTVPGLGFVFNYRADYEGADAIIIAAQDSFFILVGRKLQFSFLMNDQILAIEDTDEQIDEEVDFGML
jgi:hypothetical protein